MEPQTLINSFHKTNAFDLNIDVTSREIFHRNTAILAHFSSYHIQGYVAWYKKSNLRPGRLDPSKPFLISSIHDVKVANII